jgi:hypothetical protein
MRPDMFKVIVERPRWGRSTTVGSEYPRASLKNAWRTKPGADLDAAPLTESMGGRYARKSLNENLRPLVRFLRANVGRPWNKVRSEIAAYVSCRSAVQKHVLDHLRDYVVEHVRVEGKVVLAKGHRGFEPLVSRGTCVRFYVCPRTGLLRLAPVVARKRPRGADPTDRRVLSKDLELRRIGGIWYEVAVDRIPRDAAALAACFDVLERVSLESATHRAGESSNLLWQTGRYAVRKRQLSTREIARYELAQ